MKLKEEIKNMVAKCPEALLAMRAFAEELESVIHPKSPDPGNDIEARLDESYKRILRANKQSAIFKTLQELLKSLLLHAAAKNGVKL